MTNVPYSIEKRFKAALLRDSLSDTARRHLWRWLGEFFQFCEEQRLAVRTDSGKQAFLEMLAVNGVALFQEGQAKAAIELYHSLFADEIGRSELGLEESPDNGRAERTWDKALHGLSESILGRHYSAKTEKCYVFWVRGFQEFLGSRALEKVSASDAADFFTYLACKRKVAASTQNQAFSALLYFFRYVLKKEFSGFEGVVRSRRTKYIPVVLSREEVERVFVGLSHPFDLLVRLMYGCGLRLFEVLNLRIGCLNFEGGVLTVHDGKGRKDRTVPLPRCLVEDLQRQVGRVKSQLGKDLEKGFAGAFMPTAWGRKFPNGGRELPWQWLFPARMLTLVVETQEWRRYHAHGSKVGAAIREAARDAGLMKRVTAHTFRHSYASHLLEANFDIRTIQELLGHSSLETTMIYTHTLRSRGVRAAESPLDF